MDRRHSQEKFRLHPNFSFFYTESVKFKFCLIILDSNLFYPN